MVGFLLGRGAAADSRAGTWHSETTQTLLVLPSLFLTRMHSERVKREAQVATSFPFGVTDKSILNTANSRYTQQ